MFNEDYLRHYGILGMKWGKRKTRVTTSHTDNESDDSKKKRTLSRKRLSEMSNAELREFTTRLQLEKQYRDLTKPEVSRGRKIVTEILGTAAKQTASKYVSQYMDKGVAELLKTASK